MPSSFQDRLFRQVNSPLADALQSRARRRLMVIIAVASAAAIGAAIYTNGDRFMWMALATLPFWLSVVFLNLSLRGIFELSDDRLDEHQIAVRNHAYKTAYGFTLVFLIVVVTTATGVDLDRPAAFSVAAFAFLTSALAPRLITAWTLEDSDDVD